MASGSARAYWPVALRSASVKCAVACGVVAACVIGVYANRLSGPFLFDDQQAIVENATLHARALIDLLTPPRETPVAGRPLVNLSFALDRALFGLQPTAFHATNLALHVVCSWLLFALLRELLRVGRVPETMRQRAEAYAFAASLCFGLHPISTEIVLYTSQRSEVLAAIWYLLALLLLVRQASEPLGTSRRWLWLALVGVLGAMSKEVFATVLPIGLCLDRAFLAGSFRAALRARAGFYLALLPALLMLCALQLQDPRPYSVRFGDIQYLLAQSRIVPQYLAVALWPAHLTLDYGPLWPDQAPPAWPFIVGSSLALVGCAFAALRFPRLGFLAVWIIGILAPSSTLFGIHTELGAERRFYLPLAGLAACVVVLAGELLGRASKTRLPAAAGLAVLVAVALGARTHVRAADFRSVQSAWESAVRDSPHNARAHYNLAETYRRAGRRPRAIAEFRAALAAHEAYPDAHSNLAGELMAEGDKVGALLHLQRAAALAPQDFRVHLNFATALGLSGRLREAVQALNVALRLQPDSLDVHRKLAVALSLLGRTEEAREHARWVLAHTDRDPTALRVLFGEP